MIDTRRLKNFVIFIETILRFVLSRKIRYIKTFLQKAIFPNWSEGGVFVRKVKNTILDICYW